MLRVPCKHMRKENRIRNCFLKTQLQQQTFQNPDGQNVTPKQCRHSMMQHFTLLGAMMNPACWIHTSDKLDTGILVTPKQQVFRNTKTRTLCHTTNTMQTGVCEYGTEAWSRTLCAGVSGSVCTKPLHSQSLSNFATNVHSQGDLERNFCNFICKNMFTG